MENNNVNSLYTYNWHPLYQYIREVNNTYYVCINDDFQKGYITLENLNNLSTNKNFKFWLDYIREYDLKQGKVSPLVKVFEPLIINQFEYLVLFKYDSYVKLANKGYGFETFFELYNGLYRECRSVVFNIKTMEIVLAPQAKFKNMNEDEEWSETNIIKKITEHPQYFITNKMDGSNQNFCYNSTDKKIYYSGSQSLNPVESWRLKNGLKIFESNIGYERLLKEFPDTTFMFEYVSPDNPIVVYYTREQEGLYLFAARNNMSGEEIKIPVLQQYAQKFNIPMVDIYYSMDINDVLEQINSNSFSCDEKEGWVISIYDENNPCYSCNVFKVKLKINDYVMMHRIISNLSSPNTIVEIISDGNYDDFYSKVPFAYRDIINRFAEEIFFYQNNMEHLVLKEYTECMDETNQYMKTLNQNFIDDEEYTKVQRKKFMTVASKICTKETIGYVRAIYLNTFGYKHNRCFELNVLHNGREKDRGRSYKKIQEIREWNEKFKEKEGSKNGNP